MKRFFRNNGLSITLFLLFFGSFVFGQSLAGMYQHNDEQELHGKPPLTYSEYVTSDHFTKPPRRTGRANSFNFSSMSC